MKTPIRFSTVPFLLLMASAARASELVDWGAFIRTDAEINAILAPGEAVDVETGYDFTALLKSTGKIYSWGSIPNPPNVSTATAIAAGQLHVLALLADGTVRAWGANGDGQCNVPAGLTGVVKVAAGGGTSYALKANGTLVGWGDSSGGLTTPPAGLTGVVDIAVGSGHAIALKPDGTVVCWGSGISGYNTGPAGLQNVASVFAGPYTNYAVRTDGTVVAWGGTNQYGVLNVPPGLTGVSKISAKLEQVCAVRSDGTVTGWGDFYIAPPPGLTQATDIAAPEIWGQQTCAIGKALTVMINRYQIGPIEPALGYVTLPSPAPAGGALVSLTTGADFDQIFDVPASVTVPAGSIRASFPVQTKYFFQDRSYGYIRASYAGMYGDSQHLKYQPVIVSATGPTSVVGGSTESLVVTLNVSVPPPSNFDLHLSSYGSDLGGPAFVTFPSGQSSVPNVSFSPQLVPADVSAQLTGVFPFGQVGYTVFSVRAIKPNITAADPLVPRNSQKTGKVTLSANVRDAATIALSVNNGGVSVPATVKIAAGAKQVSFPITGVTVGDSQVTATFNGRSDVQTITVTGIGVSAIDLPASVTGQKYFKGTVRLDSPAPAGGRVITFSSSNPAVRPATSVTIPAGATSAQFDLVSSDVTAPTSATITATHPGATASGSTTVQPVTIRSFTVATATVKGGDSVEGTVTLNDTVGVNTLIDVASDDPNFVNPPASTTVVKNTKARTFTIRTKPVTSVRYLRVTVTKNGTSAYRTLKITP